MIAPEDGTSLFAAPSFEPRSMAGPRALAEAAESAFLVTFGGVGKEIEANIDELRQLGFAEPGRVDRFSAKALWEWTQVSVMRASPDVIVDASCFPREILGMLLFALSVRRHSLDRVRIIYTAPGQYVTQMDVPKDDKWLSRGIHTLRTILGYPGDFASEKRRHVVALAGHEDERLLEVISFLEPTRLSISNEVENSSTVAEAEKLSDDVKTYLRRTIGHPEYGEVTFYANSIERTFESLKEMLVDPKDENVALIAMNTKLSFIGAALCSLHLRHIRMVYSVPVEYNTCYSDGVGETVEVDITETLRGAETTPIR